MKKLFLFLFSLSILFTLNGCNKIIEEVVLYDGDQIIATFTEVEKNTEIELPIQEKNEMMFIGWTDQENNLYYDKYVVIEEITLTAVYENPLEVFELEFMDDDDIVIIKGYTGEANVLKIPQFINDYLVTNIAPYAFEEDNFEVVYIPRSTYVQGKAFNNNSFIKEVYIYGDYFEERVIVLAETEYNNILAEYSVCTIESEAPDGNSWIFSDGCPIYEVIEVNTITVQGVDYSSYQVIVNLNLLPEHASPQTYMNDTFNGAINLETVEIPFGDRFFFPEIFEGCPNIRNIIVEEGNTSFIVEEGILYNYDKTALIYYPTGLTETTFTIPEGITYLNQLAFYENNVIETLIIPENFEGNLNLSGLRNLREIIVEGNNPIYTVVDGVLFEDTELIKYPAFKSGSSYELPDGTTLIRPWAFEGNQFLEEIDLGDELTGIGNLAFQNAQSLTILEFPSSVQMIGTVINDQSSITTFIFNRSKVVDGSITYTTYLSRADNVENIYVPDDSLNDYLTDRSLSMLDEFIHPISELSD